MQQYYGAGHWFHQLAVLPPLPMGSSLPPPLLTSEGSCLPMAGAAALPLGDCSSALMIRAEEQMSFLPMISPPAVAYDDSTVVAGGYEVAAVGYAEEKQVRPAPRRVQKSSGASRPAAGGKGGLDHIGFEKLRTYFYMPITKAAREMNVGLTVLRKRCRELGLARWPYRKMKSLRSLILNIQEMGKGATSPVVAQGELEALERYCARMEENPAIELTEQTKKLRQACFKENCKGKRAAASVNQRVGPLLRLGQS